jgi:lysophospholipase L1-like esterase
VTAARQLRRGATAGLCLLLAACGGGGGGNPAAPPPPVELFSLAVLVYYDENGNGQLDANEAARVPNVTVRAGNRSARTEVLTGQATVSGVPAGPTTVRLEGLPPFYVAPAPVTVELPTSAELKLPLTLPIGGNVPNRYLAFGDSITEGEGSSSGEGYPPFLEDRLRAHFGAGELRVDAVPGSTSDEGALRIARALRNQPAFTLILYGTNDWYDCDEPAACYTTDALAAMVQQVKSAGGLPVLATIIPVNAGYDARVPPRRNEYVAEQNKLIRTLASQEGALLVDLEPAFYKAAGNDLSQLFDDHVHPNDRGYEIIADEFFKALSAPRATGDAGTSAVGWGPTPDLALDPPLVLEGEPRLPARPAGPRARPLD